MCCRKAPQVFAPAIDAAYLHASLAHHTANRIPMLNLDQFRCSPRNNALDHREAEFLDQESIDRGEAI